MKEFWNERYSEEGFVYGKAPNAFIKSVLDQIEPGRLLVPGAGEGRDAVYAASLGWQVDAFDISEAGQRKAGLLAAENQVSINYQIRDAAQFEADPETYDLVVMVFFHLPSELRHQFNRRVPQWLKPGGLVLMEVFTPEQLNFQSGGPKSADLLPTLAQIADDFEALTPLHLQETFTRLDEGPYHQGEAAVLRYIGEKD